MFMKSPAFARIVHHASRWTLRLLAVAGIIFQFTWLRQLSADMSPPALVLTGNFQVIGQSRITIFSIASVIVGMCWFVCSVMTKSSVLFSSAFPEKWETDSRACSRYDIHKITFGILGVFTCIVLIGMAVATVFTEGERYGLVMTGEGIWILAVLVGVSSLIDAIDFGIRPSLSQKEVENEVAHELQIR